MNRRWTFLETIIAALVMSLLCVICWGLMQLLSMGPEYVETAPGSDAVQVDGSFACSETR